MTKYIMTSDWDRSSRFWGLLLSGSKDVTLLETAIEILDCSFYYASLGIAEYETVIDVWRDLKSSLSHCRHTGLGSFSVP